MFSLRFWAKKLESAAFYTLFPQQIKTAMLSTAPTVNVHESGWENPFTLWILTYLGYVKHLRYGERQDCVLWHISTGRNLPRFSSHGRSTGSLDIGQIWSFKKINQIPTMASFLHPNRWITASAT